MENLRSVEVPDASDSFLVEKRGFHGSMERAKASDPVVGFDSEGIGPEAFGAEEFCALFGGPQMDGPQAATIPIDQTVGDRILNMRDHTDMLLTGRIRDQREASHLGLHDDRVPAVQSHQDSFRDPVDRNDSLTTRPAFERRVGRSLLDRPVGYLWEFDAIDDAPDQGEQTSAHRFNFGKLRHSDSKWSRRGGKRSLDRSIAVDFRRRLFRSTSGRNRRRILRGKLHLVVRRAGVWCRHRSRFGLRRSSVDARSPPLFAIICDAIGCSRSLGQSCEFPHKLRDSSKPASALDGSGHLVRSQARGLRCRVRNQAHRLFQGKCSLVRSLEHFLSEYRQSQCLGIAKLLLQIPRVDKFFRCLSACGARSRFALPQSSYSILRPDRVRKGFLEMGLHPFVGVLEIAFDMSTRKAWFEASEHRTRIRRSASDRRRPTGSGSGWGWGGRVGRIEYLSWSRSLSVR